MNRKEKAILLTLAVLFAASILAGFILSPIWGFTGCFSVAILCQLAKSLL